MISTSAVVKLGTVTVAIVSVCVLLTCRFCWACVEHVQLDPAYLLLPAICDVLLHYIVAYGVLEILSITIPTLAAVLVTIHVRLHLLVAFMAVCVVVATISACLTAASLVAMLFPV